MTTVPLLQRPYLLPSFIALTCAPWVAACSNGRENRVEPATDSSTGAGSTSPSTTAPSPLASAPTNFSPTSPPAATTVAAGNQPSSNIVPPPSSPSPPGSSTSPAISETNLVTGSETARETPNQTVASTAPSSTHDRTDGTAASVFPDGVTKPKLMIVGDSISAGPGCYKGFLHDKLQQAGITNYEFVGKYDDDCGGGVKHSAVSCSTTSDYVKETFVLANTSCSRDTFDGMSRLMSAYAPDLVMLQLGVNDVWNANAQIQPVLDNYTTLVQQARAHNPNVVVVIAQIQQINTQQAATPCAATTFSPKAKELIDAVPAWAAGASTEASKVYVADLWTNSMVSETKDCVHPTDDTGARRMADNWFAALRPLLE